MGIGKCVKNQQSRNQVGLNVDELNKRKLLNSNYLMVGFLEKSVIIKPVFYIVIKCYADLICLDTPALLIDIFQTLLPV